MSKQSPAGDVRQQVAMFQPFPVSQWQVTDAPGNKAGVLALIAVTPFGPHVYEMGVDDAKRLGQALTAPRIQVPTI